MSVRKELIWQHKLTLVIDEDSNELIINFQNVISFVRYIDLEHIIVRVSSCYVVMGTTSVYLPRSEVC